MYSFFIGIDISKDFFDVSYVLFGKVFYLDRFDNCDSGFLAMVQRLKQITNMDLTNWFICFENTGVYSKALSAWLYDSGITFKEENPIQIHRSLGLKRGKNDKADSKAIAMYCYEKRDSIEATKPCKPVILKLKKLILRRDLLVRKRTALKTSFSMQKSILDESLLELFDNQTQQLTLLLDKQVKEIETQIELVKLEDKSVHRNDKLIQSVVGIGPIVSAFTLAYTENFERINDPRKFASYMGIAPFENSSGNFTGKTKVSHLANKKLKSIFSNAAYSAINHDPQIGHYYHRKLNEGKVSGCVVNAVKNKLVQRIYSVVKRQTPYVKLNYI